MKEYLFAQSFNDYLEENKISHISLRGNNENEIMGFFIPMERSHGEKGLYFIITFIRGNEIRYEVMTSYNIPKDLLYRINEENRKSCFAKFFLDSDGFLNASCQINNSGCSHENIIKTAFDMAKEVDSFLLDMDL